MEIKYLQSGGLITNYYCTCSCRHCLYRCGPHWPKHYISATVASIAFETAIRLSCPSLHIGGGEPFLNFSALVDVLKVARSKGIQVEYIETNASWCIDEDRVKERLEKLLSLGVTTLLISISPFHLERVPLARTYTLLRACKNIGMGTFPWSQEFLNDFSRLDPRRCYTLEELEEIFGPGYIKSIPNRYWIHPGGRALELYFQEGFTLEQLLELFPYGCEELTNTSHFHMDLYGNYVPGLCSGLAIAVADLGHQLPQGKYPILNLLSKKGIKGLFEMACSMGFKAKRRSYGSKCLLCLEIRSFLVEKKGVFHELAPLEYYYQ